MRNRMYRFFLTTALGLGVSFVCGKAAVYQEVGGQVVVEAVHFDYRNFEFTDAAIPHHFHIVPDEDNVTSATHPWGDTGNNPNDPNLLNQIANSRSGHYAQIVPDNGQNKGNCTTCPNENVGFPPYAEYKVNITTTGTYQLYLRQVGWDGSSDSFFAQILEFAPPGPGPNFYRYAPDPDSGDFALLQNSVPGSINANDPTNVIGWNGFAAPAPRVDGGGGEVKALYNITTPGLYTVRLSQREDGAAVDAFILQLASLSVPTNPGPAESLISAVNPPYVRAVDPTPGQQQVPPDNNIGCQIVNGPLKNVATNTIRLVVDGATVSPSITQTGSVTYVSYSPSPLLTSGKAINWSVSFSDNGVPPTSYTNSFPFTVLPYSPIPTNFALAASQIDLTKPGFRVKPYQTAAANPIGNSLAWTEEQLDGLHGPNIADTTGTDASGYLDFTNLIDFDINADGTIVVANFGPDSLFPGQTAAGAYDSSALEVLTYLQLAPGVYRMVVNSDDGFRVSSAQDPKDRAGVVLGEFDDPAGRGIADSLFIFVVEKDGYYPFRLIWENGAGGASLEWFTQNVFGRKALVNSSTNGTLAVKAYRSGPSFPYISRFVSSPTGFAIDYNDNGGIVVNPTSFQVTLDTSPVTTTAGKTNGVTTINYTASSLLASNSTHNIGLTFNDSATPPKTYTRSLAFTVVPYATVPPSFAVGAADTTKPGFLVHPYQTDGSTDPNGVQPNTLAWTEDQLKGLHGPNVADLSGADTNGNYVETNVINYDLAASPSIAGTIAADNFDSDLPFPGLPGATVGDVGDETAEILTWLVLKAGLNQMGVNSDDGFKVTVGPNLSNPTALVLGSFDGGRGFADTLFLFYVQQDGTYPFRLLWENGNGSFTSGNAASVEWFTVLADGTKVLVNSATNTSAIKAYRAAAAAQPAPQITSATISGGNINIVWSNGGTLESTTSLSTSPINWTTTGNSSGTFSESATGTKFYRVKR